MSTAPIETTTPTLVSVPSIASVLYNGPARWFHKAWKKDFLSNEIHEMQVKYTDGSESTTYTCLEDGCGDGTPYQSDNFFSVRGHRSKHTKRAAAERRAANEVSPASIAREVERLVMREVDRQTARLRKERDAARKEANEARDALRAVRKVMQVLQ